MNEHEQDPQVLVEAIRHLSRQFDDSIAPLLTLSADVMEAMHERIQELEPQRAPGWRIHARACDKKNGTPFSPGEGPYANL